MTWRTIASVPVIRSNGCLIPANERTEREFARAAQEMLLTRRHLLQASALVPLSALPLPWSSSAMRINILVIPHNKQRYDTVGDYWGKDNIIEVRISELKNPDYEMLVILHELTELRWCLDHSVSFKSIDAFDRAYEAKRKAGDDSEPGDDPRAPYYQGHQIATAVERVAAIGLGVDWQLYSAAIDAL